MSARRKWKHPCKVMTDGVMKKTIEYTQWRNMRYRTTGHSSFVHKHPTYKDCTRVDEWNSFDNYMDWATQQVGFLSRDENDKLFVLDKDILVAGNKIYGPDTCVFIPARLNLFLLKQQSTRGKYPIGVHFNIQARKYACRLTGTYFNTAEEAFEVYKKAKESLAVELSARYEGLVDDRVIEALGNYTVNMED